jgi:hypothetical protein
MDKSRSLFLIYWWKYRRVLEQKAKGHSQNKKFLKGKVQKYLLGKFVGIMFVF